MNRQECGDGAYWSLRLFTLLQEMAAAQTNAVLKVLDGIDHLETERHYPEAGLSFGAGRWRAYYHCHQAVSMHPDEHGHFHLFTDIGEQTWAHVAGLSIDIQGQPLQWFTVNRWVTDGPWFESDLLSAQLDYIAADDEGADLVGNWLAILLQLYHEELSTLLRKRDRQLAHYSKGCSAAAVQQDRTIYRLAAEAINLQSMLEKKLLPETVMRPVDVRSQ